MSGLFLLHVVVSVGHWLPTVLGYNLIFGRGKILHFGPLGVSLATGYAMYLTLIAFDSWVLGIVAALCISSALSILFAWLAMRLEPDALGVLSIALHLMVNAVVLNWSSVTNGALGIAGVPRMPYFNGILNNQYAFAVFVLIISFIFYFVFQKVEKGRVGRELKALAEHKWHSQSLGIDMRYSYFISFLLLALVTTAGNLMFVQYIQFLHPNDYYFPAFIMMITVVIAGGAGSVRGAMIAAVLVMGLKEAVKFIDLPNDLVGPVRLLLFAVILYGAIWLRKETLFPKSRSI